MSNKVFVTRESEDEWYGFVTLLEKAAESKQLEGLLQLILTPDERVALPTRLLIVKELLVGELTQRELKERLGTGIATITRGSNSLKYITSSLKDWLQWSLLPKTVKRDDT